MIELPNPWIDSALEPEMAAESAAGSDTDPQIPAADRFVIDADRFLADVEPVPKFLSDPSPEYLKAYDIVSLLSVLAGH
jgi:hypothetical protein